MPDDAFTRALKNRRQITISVVGRRSGRTITLPDISIGPRLLRSTTSKTTFRWRPPATELTKRSMVLVALSGLFPRPEVGYPTTRRAAH